MKAPLLPVLFILLLGGCASLSQEQCQRGDWYGLGVVDGKAGEPTRRLEVHNRACAEYGVHINEGPYLAGRTEGLKTFCRLENAIVTGLAGLRYAGVCPPEIDATFAHYNNAAYAVFRTRQEMDALQARISDTELRLEANKYRDDRSRLRMDLDDLALRYSELRQELRENQHYLQYLQVEAGKRPRP
ncbi:MAG: DUF2799 domain-containing protein [Desulfobulbus sp.]|nr:DUF2799 domain-containing protein [Desulfobulbus sp.]